MMKGRLEQTVEDTDSLVNRSMERISDAADAARNTLKAGAQALIEKERVAVGQARRVVEDNPLSAVSVALVAGFLLGWLVRNTRDY